MTLTVAPGPPRLHRPAAPRRRPRLHRALRAGQDDRRRHRPRSRLLAGPRSTATSTASPPSCVRAVTAEFERVAGAVIDAGPAAPTFGDAVVAVAITGARVSCAARRAAVPPRARARSGARHLAFGPGDRVLVAVGDAVAPAFDRWLSPDDATRAGDWLARLLRSYVLMPHPPVDFTDPAAARAFLENSSYPASTHLNRRNHDQPHLLDRSRRHHRSRRHQRLDAILADHQHRRRRGRARGPTPTPTPSSRGTTSGAVPRWRSSTRRRRRRSGTPTTFPGTSTSTRRRSRATTRTRTAIGQQMRPRRHAVREVGRQGVARSSARVAELDALAVHAR